MSRLLLAALLFSAALAGAEPSSLPAQPPDDATLVRMLRAGGLVLYIRHTSTDFSQNDAQMKSFEDCASQRNLTDRGRDEARRIGESIRRLRIPIGKVLASPYCRTVETGQLVFGRAEKMNEVRGGPVQSDDPRRYDALKKLLSTRPPKGSNLAISSHGNPFYAVAGPPYLQEGEIAVLEPGGTAGFKVVARIKPGDWARIAP